MRNLDFSPLFRSTVGFDRLFDLLDSASDAGQGYPPYNIERTDENAYRVSVAVAGFAEQDLEIEVRDGVLTVTGRKDVPETSSYLHRGIAGRAFERRFQLAEHVEVRGARLENGLLHIDLERVIPEEKKPRRIAIGSAEVPKVTEEAKAA